MLVLLLLSQPLAAADFNCGVGMGQPATDSSEHCAGHSNGAGPHQPASDEQHGHTLAGGHCHSCGSGVLLIPVSTRLDSIFIATAGERSIPLRAAQFQSGPLYRPPILH